MKKKSIFLMIFLASLMFPTLVQAQEEQVELEQNQVLAQTVKYYKTITRIPNAHTAFLESMNDEPTSYTVEVTEEEYNNASTDPIVVRDVSTMIETNYKQMTTKISQFGNYYEFSNDLHWKNMPAVRAYDIIGIGFGGSLTTHGSMYFEQNYCETGGNCYTATAYTPQYFDRGFGASFPVKTGSLSSLDIHLDCLIKKNVSYTLTSISAIGDYSHAVNSNVNSTMASLYTMGVNGIALSDSVYNKFDTINEAVATLTGISW